MDQREAIEVITRLLRLSREQSKKSYPRRSREWYRETYLYSKHWIKFRDRWHTKYPNAPCKECGAHKPLDLHHITYARLGRERLTDVIGVCRDCHIGLHG